MLVPLGWLKDYIEWDMPEQELLDRLTYAGLEVKAADKVGAEWDAKTIYVGQVIDVQQHPNADRLVLATVEYGQDEPLTVVTGAPNVRVGEPGQKVVFATVGARLRDAYADTLKYKTLKKGKIRGIVSMGMVCSERELGISDEHEGILTLPDDAPVGTPFCDYWGDTVLDLDLTPNLARCFSMVGIARDMAALLGTKYRMPSDGLVAKGEPIEGQIHIEIADPDLCPRYSASLIKGVKIGPSPMWMQRRLILAGMRPINNIVDITNYVMLELGQPLHAFDYRLIRPKEKGGEPTIIVRRAHEDEKMTTLDGIDHVMNNNMLLITDGGGPVAVAGVMGGLETEVSDGTVDILLEGANFEFISVRRTSFQLKISSEAAQRLGRGVDPELTLVALERASELMRQLAGGTVAKGYIDVYPGVPEPKIIDLNFNTVARLLGLELEGDKIAEMLTALGFGCDPADDRQSVQVTVPTFRQDCSIEADLAEEVARMYGYNELPVSLILDEMPPQSRNMELELEEQARDILVGTGLTEVLSYSMTNLESIAKLSPEQTPVDGEGYVRLANPLTREHEYMRQTMMNTTLEMVSRNLRFVNRVAIFEIAHVYLPVEGELLPDEPTYLSVALCGPREDRSWLTDDAPTYDFYDLKGIVETLCRELGIDDVAFAPATHSSLHPGRCASLSINGKEIGLFGEVHPLVRNHFDIADQDVYLLELNLSELLVCASPTHRFETISRMPALKMDLAMVVDEGVAADELEAAIRKAGGRLLVDVVLFDVYRGEQVGADKKSLAYSLTFQSPDKTLKTNQATKQRDRIVKALKKSFGADIRS